MQKRSSKKYPALSVNFRRKLSYSLVKRQRTIGLVL
jgi:hypothetical protein